MQSVQHKEDFGTKQERMLLGPMKKCGDGLCIVAGYSCIICTPHIYSGTSIRNYSLYKDSPL